MAKLPWEYLFCRYVLYSCSLSFIMGTLLKRFELRVTLSDFNIATARWLHCLEVFFVVYQFYNASNIASVYFKYIGGHSLSIERPSRIVLSVCCLPCFLFWVEPRVSYKEYCPWWNRKFLTCGISCLQNHFLFVSLHFLFVSLKFEFLPFMHPIIYIYTDMHTYIQVTFDVALYLWPLYFME